MEKLKVANESGLVRDTKTSAILSQDVNSLSAYRANKERNSKIKLIDDLIKKVEELERRILKLESNI